MKLSSAPQAIVKAFQMCVKRFPVSVSFVTALSLFLVFNIIDEGDLLKDSFIDAVSYYLSIGFLLSLTLHLWQEEGRERRTVLIVNTVAHLALLADSIYIYYLLEDKSNFHADVWVAHISIIFSLLLSQFFLPFLKEKDNVASWNFTMRLIVNAIICYVIGGIMWGGFSLLLASFNTLFGIDINSKWYLVIGVLTGVLLSSWLFLGRIPNGKDKHNRTPVNSGFLNAVMRFLFLPLVGLYMIVLYIYAIQILVKWELPDGWVSWLVVASMAGLIIIEFGLYPVRKAQDRKADHLIARYLPVVILPMLLLMTVGIVRRFNDYGTTINRLYLITINLWFYFVCITLFLTKARRINWITISFALLFVLTSAFPINYFSITRYYMDSHIAKTLKGKRLPLTAKQYKAFLLALPEKEAATLNEQLKYLADTYGYRHTDKYVKESGYFSFNFYEDIREEGSDTIDLYISQSCNKYAIDIPEGYNKMVQVYTPPTYYKKGQHIVKIVPTLGEETFDTVFVNLDTLRSYKNAMPHPLMLPCSSDQTRYYVTSFSIEQANVSSKQRVDVTGFILQKKQ